MTLTTFVLLLSVCLALYFCSSGRNALLVNGEEKVMTFSLDGTERWWVKNVQKLHIFFHFLIFGIPSRLC